ncbi:MAG: ParB/RepB/Spo0J family partition protein [Desulfobacterales bacterium]|jgi:ParB family chromosome partitioning protein
MSKTYKLDAEERSIFLSPTDAEGRIDKKGERENTSPISEARFIDIGRIKPDPNQPRKKFVQKTLESLAESIKELGGIIDPLTVEYDEQQDFFRIISGERRYRAAKMVGMERLPCIIKEVDDKKRLLFQFIANLQREDITSIEEAAGIKSLMEKFGYTQTKIARLLNKSESYISQILGLERLTPSAREILQTSEVVKEVQIQASREKNPDKQKEILKKASEQGKTVKQIRGERKTAKLIKYEKNEAKPSSEIELDETIVKEKKFRKWIWEPENGSFVLTIQFNEEQNENKKYKIVKAVLKAAYEHVSR